MSEKSLVLSSDEIIESGLLNYSVKLLPEINRRIDKLNELSIRVEEASEAATKAEDSAKNAMYMSAGFGKKKAAIEGLQKASVNLAEAVQAGAEAQRISFEFQRELAEISKYLFGLGVSNLAMNRTVVRELELRLKGASEEELSELARQELMTVIKQLKAQEDILLKLDKNTKWLKNHEESMKNHEEIIKNQLLKIQQIDEELQKQADVDKVLENQLKIQDDTNKWFEQKLHEQEAIYKDQEEQLVNLREKNSELNEQIKKKLEIIQEQDTEIQSLKKEIADIKVLLDSKANSTFSKITLVISVLAFIISVIHFFV